MPDLGLRFSNMNPDQRAATIERAGDALCQGQCVVMPTDTLYGLITQANNTGSTLLNKLTGYPEIHNSPQMTLHLADLDQILEHLVLEAPTTRRLIHRLLPGPVRFVIEQPPEAIDKICQTLNIDRGRIDDGQNIALRVPDHPICRQVLRSAKVACVGRRLGAAIWAVGENPGSDLSLLPDHPDPKPALILDDGPTQNTQGSTTVRLAMDGRIQVDPDGVLSEREVLDHLERTMLFVCTGNTCRSPMAQAIAQHLINQSEPQGIVTHVTSAGVAAGQGYPATDEAVQVLKNMGIDPGNHSSQQLTLAMIDQAEVIYTMTPSHAQAVMTMAPNSVHKVFVLNESQGVPDPIGQGIDVYQQTAERLEEFISARLQEIRI